MDIKNDYNNIINLPHHVSKRHPQMSRHDRAAQFSAFAALTGYEDAVRETARLTGSKIELDDDAKALLDIKFSILKDNIKNEPTISVTYFVPDEKKSGGEYVTISCVLQKIDELSRKLILTDGTIISIDDIIAMDGDVFSATEESL